MNENCRMRRTLYCIDKPIHIFLFLLKFPFNSNQTKQKAKQFFSSKQIFVLLHQTIFSCLALFIYLHFRFNPVFLYTMWFFLLAELVGLNELNKIVNNYHKLSSKSRQTSFISTSCFFKIVSFIFLFLLLLQFTFGRKYFCLILLLLWLLFGLLLILKAIWISVG